jgi:glycine cleavage system regulatory protein
MHIDIGLTMNHYLTLTIISDDRPGVIEKVATIVASHGGNWLESNMSRLAGKFAGILLVNVETREQPKLLQELGALSTEGIKIIAEPTTESNQELGEHLLLTLVGNDRPGIIGELSSILTRLDVNVEELCTNCEDAPMSSETLFKASAVISFLNSNIQREELRYELELLSDDLIVELEVLSD